MIAGLQGGHEKSMGLRSAFRFYVNILEYQGSSLSPWQQLTNLSTLAKYGLQTLRQGGTEEEAIKDRLHI